MRPSRRRKRTSIDLIGFLDILSAVMVIVLLVISVLALSLGVDRGRTARVEARTKPAPKPAPAPGPAKPIADPWMQQPSSAATPLVALNRADGVPVTGSTTFLLCRSGQVERHDPISGAITARWDLNLVPPELIAEAVRSDTIYLAVAGSCFTAVQPLVAALRSTGAQLGYEPIGEGARTPWR
ncbi:hypothetical protein KBY97_10320 [Synechococcus sp. ATX 2A4]|uniref:hypothetical protein n=1 Tax=Synechococcus sp. ATX 2A4 TaxID=2823727 RepID=UPI0020CB97F1|nr:hypothetical protein [Synechococcus sp. ATX 2A4]MCP9885514.1 hypothetical protein [Synechococcus sp. ATX 2A4]